MKRLFTLFFVVSVLSATVWAADWATTYEENYANATKAGVTSTVKSYTRKAHPCLEWSYLKVRIKGDTLPLGKQAIWLNRNVSPLDDAVDCYLECAHIEGGVKNISFLYKQANSGDDGKIICLALKADDVRLDSLRFTGASKYRTSSRTYSKALGIKSNAKLTLQNISHTSNTDYTIIPGRLTIGALTITPYLLYRQKDVTIGTKQQGYVNRELLDNTGGTETITYLSSDETIAQVNAETGVVTPIKAGNVTISASLDGGTTTITYYTLHVVDGILCENFSKVVNQTGSAPENTPWDGDLFGWTVNKARRFTNDTIYDSPRVQGTWLAENDGNVQSTNAVEGGVKHITFDWMQWSNVSSSTVKVLYGDEEKVVDAQTEISQYNHFTIDEDINGTSNAVLKISNASPSSPSDRITIGAIKITPYLLYTTKEATLDTRNTLTYTNTGLIDNTTGDAPNYEISPANAAVSINAEGQVAVEDGAEVNADFTVTASWSAVTTSYTLHIMSRTITTASYANSAVRLSLGDAVSNALNITDGYEDELASESKSITYISSNTAVATVASDGTVSLAGGVGQTTITATLPATANFTAAEASYNLFVRDNESRIEMFSSVSQSGVVGETLTDWSGDLFTWQAQYQVRRGTNDTIHAGISKHQGTSIGIQDPTGTPLSSILQSKDAVEGGIKYLTFYWMQWGAASDGTRRIAVYADDDLIGYQENPRGTSGKTGDEFMLGINNAMKSNKKLVIKNESYKGSVGTLSDATNCSRIVLDNIYITPYLRYTTKERTLDLHTATSCTYIPDVDNTESGTITYSLEDNDDEASIDAETGEVTGLKAGQVTVKATWSEGAFVTYTLNIISITETEASYPNAEIHATMGEAIPANALAYTYGYDGEISYASNNPAVADFENGVLKLKAIGQTKITATLPETSNYTSATASYLLTVGYANYESFNHNTTSSTYAKPEENAQGDQCKWYAYIGGIKMPDHFSSNAITTRAQRANESKQGYVKSAILSGGISALSFNYSMMFADDNIDKWDIRVYVNDRLVGQLTNEAGGDLEGINGRTLNPMRTKVITGINEPGKFVIRFENHSTIKEGVTYTEGNMGRFAIDNVSWEGYNGTKSLAENEDNNGWIRSNGGETCNVTITRSAMFANVYNTICLPFAISKADDLDDADVQEMTSASIDGDVLTIRFSALDGDELQAGKPYLVKPTSNKDISGTYSSKQISSIASPVTFGSVTLQGIYSPTPLKANDYSTLFVGVPDDEGNNLFYPSEDASLNGFRAYFKINEAMGAPIRHARFVTDQENMATGSEEVRSETVGTVRSEKILENGQLIIIRDGVRYDVLGRKK